MHWRTMTIVTIHKAKNAAVEADRTGRGALPAHHCDPFDRMLMAQALLEDCELISNETIFDRYGVTRLW